MEGINHRDDIRRLGQTLLLLRRNQRPQLVYVDDGSPVHVAGQVEVAHTDLTEVTRMVLIEVGSININVKCILIKNTYTF